MILCQFNMPWYDNNGQAKSQVHRLHVSKLLKEFGGATIWDAKGEWHSEETGRHYSEMVTVYQIAVENLSKVEGLKQFAIAFGVAMKQEAIFFAVQGKAEIISCQQTTK